MDVKLPNLGEGADSGVVVNILVNEGDVIAQDQIILELETGKAVAPIPTSAAGTVTKIRVKVGDKISSGATLLTLDGGNAKAAAATPADAQTVSKKAAQQPPPGEPAPIENEPSDSTDQSDAATPSAFAPPASPSIRKVARELGIDLARIRGSEAGGRIVMGDLRSYIQRLQRVASQAKAPAAPTATAPAASIDFSVWGPISKRPLTPLRQTIARRMTESWTTIPHVTQFDDADITGLNELRKKYAPAYEAKGAHLTLTSFVIKAVVATLRKHPAFNSSLDEATQSLVLKNYFHIGLAVDTEAGLIVPVIRNAGDKTMADVSRDISDLAVKARERKITLEDMKGGTFTVSNQGGIGSAHFTPIINKPEVAILGLGRGAMKPVVKAGKIEIRLMMPLGLSYDHRVIDGGSAARFMVDLVGALETFGEAEVKI